MIYPSNDSVVIANWLGEFKYAPDKKDKILQKYNIKCKTLEEKHTERLCEVHQDLERSSYVQAFPEPVIMEFDSESEMLTAALEDLEAIMLHGGENIDTCNYCSSTTCYGRGGPQLCAPVWHGRLNGKRLEPWVVCFRCSNRKTMLCQKCIRNSFGPCGTNKEDLFTQ